MENNFMKPYTITFATNDPGTFIVRLHDLDGGNLDPFEVPTDLYHSIDTFPAPDPFRVIAALRDHFTAYADTTALAGLDNAQDYYNTHYREVMTAHYKAQKTDAYMEQMRCAKRMTELDAVLDRLRDQLADLAEPQLLTEGAAS